MPSTHAVMHCVPARARFLRRLGLTASTLPFTLSSAQTHDEPRPPKNRMAATLSLFIVLMEETSEGEIAAALESGN